MPPSSVIVNSDIIMSKPHKKRKRTTKKTNKRKEPKPKKQPKAVVVPNTSPRISDDEGIFFSQILAKKDTAKKKIHESIEKATAVMADAKLEIQKCPFCKKYSASYNMRQSRSADEGSTAEFKCSNELCARRWRGRSWYCVEQGLTLFRIGSEVNKNHYRFVMLSLILMVILQSGDGAPITRFVVHGKKARREYIKQLASMHKNADPALVEFWKIIKNPNLQQQVVQCPPWRLKLMNSSAAMSCARGAGVDDRDICH